MTDWSSSSWKTAAAEYHRDRAGRPVIAEIDPRRLKRLRRLLRDNASLDAVWAELNDPRNRPTPEATIEAVMDAVRERGLAALKEPATVKRLGRCDVGARAEINRRIEKLGPKP